MIKEIFTREELEEMDHCITRIALQLLMASAVVGHIDEVLDSKMPTCTNPA